MCVNC